MHLPKKDFGESIKRLPLVRELEKTGLFVNYKVSVTFNENGKICYPYILEPGIADQNIVFKVLSEKGFSKNFLDGSSQMLTHLETNKENTTPNTLF